MSGRCVDWLLQAVRVAWFHRAQRLLPAWVLVGSFVLCIATPSRAEDLRPREVRVCVRPPGAANLDRWVVSPGGKVLTERWGLMVYKTRQITVYVFDPKAPPISATYFPPGLFGDLQCAAKVAPNKVEPKAARKKSEAGPRKKKEAEEPEAPKPEAQERKAEEAEGKEREAKKARSRKEAEEAKQERERREKQAQEEERRRLRERDRPKVLPRHGVTAAWPSQVLPEQKREGVTAAWPSKVLLPTRVLPMAGAPLCGAPAPKLAGGKETASTMAVREPILKELLGYKKTQSEAGKEAHRRKLRELFERLGPSAAEPFQVMLSTQNALAVTFREVLRDDPLQNELLGILAKKYTPDPTQCTPTAPPPAPPSGVTLPAVTLTDEESFDVLHAEVEQRITAIREAGNALTSPPQLMKPKKLLLERLLPDLESLLRSARWWKFLAFHPASAASKAEALKKAGAATAGALVVSQN